MVVGLIIGLAGLAFSAAMTVDGVNRQKAMTKEAIRKEHTAGVKSAANNFFGMIRDMGNMQHAARVMLENRRDRIMAFEMTNGNGVWDVANEDAAKLQDDISARPLGVPVESLPADLGTETVTAAATAAGI